MAELLVSASTGAMGSLLGKLGTMLSDEFKLLKGVRDDISPSRLSSGACRPSHRDGGRGET